MRASLFAIVLACGACDALAATDYAGEPVLRLQGVASSAGSGELAQSGVLAAALWQSTSANGASAFTRLALSLEFPDFYIDMLALPGPAVEFPVGDGEPPIAEAYLHIVQPDTGAQPKPSDFLATDTAHALVYVTAAPSDDSLTAAYLGGSLPAGFHVMNRTPVETLTPAQEWMVARCIASATGLTPSQAEASCTARHLYVLQIAPDDLATVLSFHVDASAR